MKNRVFGEGEREKKGRQKVQEVRTRREVFCY